MYFLHEVPVRATSTPAGTSAAGPADMSALLVGLSWPTPGPVSFVCVCVCVCVCVLWDLGPHWTIMEFPLLQSG